MLTVLSITSLFHHGLPYLAQSKVCAIHSFETAVAIQGDYKYEKWAFKWHNTVRSEIKLNGDK